MNVIGKRTIMLNEYSLYYNHIGIIIGKVGKYRYKISLPDGDFVVGYNAINIIEDDGSLLVNNINLYCNWCHTELKNYWFENVDLYSYINYCPKCLR